MTVNSARANHAWVVATSKYTQTCLEQLNNTVCSVLESMSVRTCNTKAGGSLKIPTTCGAGSQHGKDADLSGMLGSRR